jgi:hypothetical protein
VNVLSPYTPIWSEGGHYFRSQGGTPRYSGWRMSGAIMGDAAVLICSREPGVFTGNILYDHEAIARLGGLSTEEVARRYPIEP